MKSNAMNRRRLLFVLASALVVGALPFLARAATLSVGPSSGSYEVGSTFEVSVFLNTQGQSVNLVDFAIIYPPDRLQIVTPSTGNSIIGIWTAQPKLNNLEGRAEFQGGIPGGVNVSKGLVTSLTFRVKSVGTALVRFGDSSRVLLNDGKATDALTETASGYYQLALPPPAGPIVISETHPLQSIWYANPNVTLAWDSDPGVEGYSYVLNDEPADVVDDISEGTKNSIVYRGVADGTHYFHLKALRDETWGGTTHFAVRVDATPPASFPIEVAPGARTVRRQPVIQFSTTDFHSGIDHYELKIVPLAPENTAKAITKFGSGDEAIFVEAQSPYLTPALDLGTYDAIVRAYDRAGNYREVIRKLTIVNQIFQVVAGRGLVIGSQLTLPWNAVWAIAAVLIAFLAVLGWRTRVRHRAIDARRAASELPPNVRSQLDELKRFREKYGTTLALLFALGLSFALSAPVRAAGEQGALISPPLVTTVSRDISNEEIFYVGGRTDAPQTDVVLYLQDL
ncbi:MAG: cohesin domain-containing protein, partial [Patescibacteria group bacterium]